jgi:hypothetical protein
VSIIGLPLRNLLKKPPDRPLRSKSVGKISFLPAFWGFHHKHDTAKTTIEWTVVRAYAQHIVVTRKF